MYEHLEYLKNNNKRISDSWENLTTAICFDIQLMFTFFKKRYNKYNVVIFYIILFSSDIF